MVANSAAHEWPATGSATTPTVIDPDLFAVILYLWSCSAPESDHRYKITGERGEPKRNGDENGQVIEVSRTTWPSVCLERMTGIEPALSAWEAEVLPLNYIRVGRSELRPAAVVILAQVRGGRASPGRFRGGPRSGARCPGPTPRW